MVTVADRIIAFNKQLDFSGNLPDGISIMNPFKENDTIIPVSSAFYQKYYNDNNPRHLILGINPGRFGAGVTGIPFTDPKFCLSAWLHGYWSQRKGGKLQLL